MALIKQKTLANGTTGNYWRVTEESYNRNTLICRWKISLFKDEETSQSGAPSLDVHKVFTYTATKLELAGNRTQLAYIQIKLQANTLIPCIPFEGYPETQRPFDVDLANAVDS